jgi:hypothetical protein
MTHDAKLRFRTTTGKIVSNLLLAFVAALGTHYLDVLAVKDRVENIRTEQIENSKWRIEDQARWQRYDEVDLPTLLNGQRVLLKCIWAQKHGEIDRECDWEVWQTRNRK